MGITEKSIKLLWTASGGRCGFTDCRERLCFHEAADVAPYTLGEMAHICGEKPGSNRHDSDQSAARRDDYRNLILLCPTHHTLIDRKENELAYPVEKLHEMKAAHEALVLARLSQDGVTTKIDLARKILPLLEENSQSWGHFGPLSDLARAQPHNEAAHAVWISERLSVIVPNNRKVGTFIHDNMALFDAGEHATIASFLLHIRSYEQWVDDAIPYSAVKRFPVEFDDLIRRIADGES
jgi:HNH endonuclease